jgi:glutamate-1-semialdehyde 2,1-aminomutase
VYPAEGPNRHSSSSPSSPEAERALDMPMPGQVSESGAPDATRLDAAVAAASAQYSRRNARSGEIAAAAARCLPGGNTRTSLWYDPFPLCMVRGEGSRLKDADGHEYVDFLGEFTAGIYGHSPHVVKDAIRAALEEGLNLSSQTRWESKLATIICARFASMQLVRFTNSGTEANLMALAAAVRVTGRRKILVFEGAYHGSVLSFLPAGSAARVPHEFICGRYNDIEGSRALVDEHRDGLAGILVEPMLGAGGCIPGTPEFLQSLRRSADDAGAILIFDEIQTARLSVGGRQKLLGIEPDLTTLGKFFGGGLAFGCFGGRRDIMDIFDPRRPDAVAHAGTFNNNTLTMAAGAAALTGLLTEGALDLLNQRGERLRESMLSMFRAAGAPFEVTGLGSLMSIHPKRPSDRAAALRKLLFFELLAAGIYTAARGSIALSLAITDEDTSRLLRALESFLDRNPAMLSR